MTSVTCGPRCPGAPRTSSVSPGCTLLTPMPASAVAWRNTSPLPSESSTKPYLLSGLYHFTLPQTGCPDGSSSRWFGELQWNLRMAPRILHAIVLDDLGLRLLSV